MKLKDFLTLKSGSGILLSGTRYNPYINYSWSQTLTVGGKQQIKDIGTAGINLQQFFGQGCWFNGIDQNIVLETVAPVETSPIWTICFNVNTASSNKYIIRTIGGVLKVLWFNGGLTYYNGSANITLDTTNSNRAGSYVVKSDGSNIYTYLNNILISTIPQTVGQLSFGLIKDLAGYSSGSSYLGVLKDVYLFKKSLSETEINNYFNQPNQFFMDSLEDSSCVLAMPMCEKDGFVRNYKSYSEGSNLVVNGKFESDSNWNLGGWTVSNGVLVSSKVNGAKCTQAITLPINSIIEVSVDVLSFSGTSLRLYERDGGLGSLYLIGSFMTTTGSFKFLYRVQSSNFVLNIYDGDCNCTIDNVSVKQLTSIYPITNYLTTCRTNAQRLPYGLQTSGFKRDTNGLILSKSNFLEADGVGYGNTGWVPKWNEDFTVESVFEVSNDSEFRLNGNNYADGIYFGKNSVGKSLYVRVFGSAIIRIANTKDIVCLTFSYNWQSKEVKCYVDGVLKNTQLATLTTNSTLPVLLGMVDLASDNYPVIKPIRLFKVHAKVLTQEEITKNFNKYQSQGLLNE